MCAACGWLCAACGWLVVVGKAWCWLIVFKINCRGYHTILFLPPDKRNWCLPRWLSVVGKAWCWLIAGGIKINCRDYHPIFFLPPDNSSRMLDAETRIVRCQLSVCTLRGLRGCCSAVTCSGINLPHVASWLPSVGWLADFILKDGATFTRKFLRKQCRLWLARRMLQ